MPDKSCLFKRFLTIQLALTSNYTLLRPLPIQTGGAARERVPSARQVVKVSSVVWYPSIHE